MTHWHHDHIGGVSDVLKLVQTNVPVHKFPRYFGQLLKEYFIFSSFKERG